MACKRSAVRSRLAPPEKPMLSLLIRRGKLSKMIKLKSMIFGHPCFSLESSILVLDKALRKNMREFAR